jgi:site-specific recombinase XerD
MHRAHRIHAGRSPTTLRRYVQLWRTWLAPTLGAIPPNDLRRADLEHALAHMHDAEQSDRSIHQAAVLLNTAFAWAHEHGIVETNPVVGCELPNGGTLTASRRRL